MAQHSETANRAEFDRVYREHSRAVERHLVYLTGDRQLAEDLAQETFGKLYERSLFGGDEAIRDPRAWLITVASRLAYNHFRAEGRRASRESAVEPASQADRDDVLDVRCALERLDYRDRTVLLLRHTGFSYAEIAAVVGVAPGSVGTTLARAQRRFKQAYEGAHPSASDKE